MSRDKCGAAATAGLMASIAALQPQGVKVGMLRFEKLLLLSFISYPGCWGPGNGEKQRWSKLLCGGRDHHEQGGGEDQGGQH